jgi:TIR domain
MGRFFARMLEDHHNISVFVDTQQLDKAVRFPVRLRDAIENCDVFVCLLADETLRSQWVKEEIRIAHEKNKPMVPVFQESYVHPEDDKELEPHIRTLLSYDGVHLLDKRNIHTDHTIEDLAKIVKQTML